MKTKVTISGRIGTGKSTLFWSLYRKLVWPTFSAGSFFRHFAESEMKDLGRAVEQERELTLEIDRSIGRLLEENERVIIEGWMAGIMAAGVEGVVRVLLVCEDNERFRRVAVRDRLSLAEAERKLRERESSWKQKLKEIYGREDFFDEDNYDLVIDTGVDDEGEVLGKVVAELGV